MRLLVIYKNNTDYTREVTSYLRDFEHQTGHKIEEVNPDTPEGIHFCQTYGIVQYPTVISLTDNGIMQQTWPGLPMPTIMEISFYTQLKKYYTVPINKFVAKHFIRVYNK